MAFVEALQVQQNWCWIESESAEWKIREFVLLLCFRSVLLLSYHHSNR